MKKNRKKKIKEWQGRRAHSEMAERLYVAIRSGMSKNKFYLNEIWKQRVSLHFKSRFRNDAEAEALLKLQGGLAMLQKIGRFTQTKGQAQQAWAAAQALRYDKFLTKSDALTAFALGGKPKPIPADRPSEFEAKGSPYYPRYGSSRGKVRTIMKGAVKTNKAFEDFVNSLIRLGSSTKDRVKIKRTITQSMKL